MTSEELQTEIGQLIDREDSVALEQFVIDHFKEFPEETQGKILIAFASEAIEQQEGEEAVEKMRTDGLEALNKISALKAVLELSSTSNE